MKRLTDAKVFSGLTTAWRLAICVLSPVASFARSEKKVSPGFFFPLLPAGRLPGRWSRCLLAGGTVGAVLPVFAFGTRRDAAGPFRPQGPPLSSEREQERARASASASASASARRGGGGGGGQQQQAREGRGGRPTCLPCTPTADILSQCRRFLVPSLLSLDAIGTADARCHRLPKSLSILKARTRGKRALQCALEIIKKEKKRNAPCRPGGRPTWTTPQRKASCAPPRRWAR